MRLTIAVLIPVLLAGGCSDSRAGDGPVACTGRGGGDAAAVGCGDGKMQGTEECDSGGETWECDSTCHRTRMYTACRTNSDCRDGQDCVGGACTQICVQQANGSFSCPSADIPEHALGVVCYIEAEGDYGYCRPRCKSMADCPQSLRCDDNVCVPDLNGNDGSVSM